MTALADLAVFAGGVAGAAVNTVGLEVEASAFALGLSLGTIHRTLAVAADFTFLTLGSARAAVLTIVLGVDTNIVAVGLSFGTVGLHTLTAIAVVLTGAIFDFCSILKAATCILHAKLVLTWKLSGFGGTLEGAFGTLCIGTVGNAFVVFALLEVATGFEAYTLRPNTTLTTLGSFDAGFATVGKTCAAFTGGTLHALVVDTSCFIAVSAVFVFEAVNTATCSVAFFACGTVLVGAANTTVVFRTFFGGAGVGLAVSVLQARNTLSFGGCAVQQTSVGTIFTTRDGNGDFTAAAHSNK